MIDNSFMESGDSVVLPMMFLSGGAYIFFAATKYPFGLLQWVGLIMLVVSCYLQFLRFDVLVNFKYLVELSMLACAGLIARALYVYARGELSEELPYEPEVP